MPVSYQFLPWLRRGLTVALTQTETLASNLPARATAQVGVKLAGAHQSAAIAPLAMQLYGPGDVVGIDTALVVRTDPRPGITNFEPNYLAIVDFDAPDFPWMLTPALANSDERLRPWLVLVVLRKDKVGEPKPVGSAPLLQIRVAAGDVATELPPLADAWSWAHAQVVSKAAAADAAAIQADLQGDPRSNVSRLVCPRRLEPDTDYVACVVPAFEPGRLRGLGLGGDGNGAGMKTLAPAWNAAANADVVLPVYYHWQFSTGAAGDFEYLARKLRTPRKWKDDPVIGELLRHIGTMPMSVDELLGEGENETMEGALVPIGYETGKRPQAVHADALETIVNTPASQVDNPVVDEPDGTVRRIEVKPPLYGAWHMKTHAVQDTQVGQWWLAGLNLTPRYRGAAGYGAEVVRKNQEDYVDACWDQVGAIRDAEMKFNLTRLAIEAQRRLKARHFDVLPDARLMQLMGSALPRIEALDGANRPVFRVGGVTASLGGQVDRSSLPAAMVDGALRRLSSPQQRRLRTAAMRTQGVSQLTQMAVSYVQSMAAATTKAAAFNVNAFTPDGIAGTALFDGVALDAASIDLSARGFRQPLAGAQVRETLVAARKAERIAQGPALPLPPARLPAGKGVFTDIHVQRFGQLAAATPGVTFADFGRITTHLNQMAGTAGAGLLVEAQVSTGLLQFSAIAIDPRSGVVRVERPLQRRLPDRRLQPAGRIDIQRAAGVVIGKLQPQDMRLLNNASLFASLPANTLNLQGPPGALVNLRLTNGLDFERISGGTIAPAVKVPSVTLPPALTQAAVLKNFEQATLGTQALWRDAFQTQRVQVQVTDFPVASSAAIVRVRTQPDLTLAARLATQVSIADAAFASASAHVATHLLATGVAANLRFAIPRLFDRVMAFPHLREPMYRALAEYDREAFMPGIGNLPQDLIMLVQVNQAFIDSFMVGANVEMNHELLWRGFPTDLRGTPFQRFWGKVGGGDDMDPIHLWRQQKLGARQDPNITDPDRIALIVKGRLLLRYPNTQVYAWRRNASAGAGKSKLLKNAQGEPPDRDNDIQTPVFAGFIAPDITFFGFDIDREEVKDWCFVVEEQMSEPRFGFDVPLPPEGQRAPVIGPRPRAGLKAARAQWQGSSPSDTQFKALRAQGLNPWKLLSWSDLSVVPGKHVTVSELVTMSQAANAPLPDFPRLPDKPNAAQIAQALLQEPFRAYWEGPDLVMPE